MKVTIAPASPKTGASAIRWLLSSDNDCIQVNALYRNLDKVPDEFRSRPNFTATQADVADAPSLDFSGTDAVLVITPPVYDGRDVAAHAEVVSINVRDAIEKAGTVKRVVLLTSVGAHLSEGVGEVKTNHIAETVFAATKVPEIVFVRCAYFMENWAMDLRTLREPQPYFYSTITPLDMNIPMVAVTDIGRALATELVKEPSRTAKPHIFELQGPQDYSPLDVQDAFSQALGKQVEVKSVEKEGLREFYSAIFPPSVVNDWVEMAVSFLPGGVMYENPSHDEVVHGETGLEEAIKAAVGVVIG
ncbi:hypothetical protein B0T10DRAFT_487604 [Thelonectria olida]|uniref:NmrA-like domain-containing protein n=1 Tax=Thelonectria olida TaxID=1576542 RepID=A0A9P8W4M4_9HYPO|nr:hypothetical protein B0T10DRAFT_487604 [Thelonectria olida]